MTERNPQRKWSVRTFITEQGRRPVEEFIASLAPEPRVAVIQAVRLLAHEGIDLALPHSRPVREGIHELRAWVGRNEYRVLYAHVHGRTFLLLHGFTKKTERTDERDVRTALARRAAYLERHKRGR